MLTNLILDHEYQDSSPTNDQSSQQQQSPMMKSRLRSHTQTNRQTNTHIHTRRSVHMDILHAYVYTDI